LFFSAILGCLGASAISSFSMLEAPIGNGSKIVEKAYRRGAEAAEVRREKPKMGFSPF
jgi:hypothetical protein